MSSSEPRAVAVIGKTGAGKSTLCNALTKSKDFQEGRGSRSMTVECKDKTATIKGRKITVIDTPGTRDVKDKAGMLTKLDDSLKNCPDGIDAFLIAMRCDGRATEEEFQAIDDAVDAFGPESFKRAIVVFTRGGEFKNNELKFLKKEAWNRKIEEEEKERKRKIEEEEKERKKKIEEEEKERKKKIEEEEKERKKKIEEEEKERKKKIEEEEKERKKKMDEEEKWFREKQREIMQHNYAVQQQPDSPTLTGVFLLLVKVQELFWLVPLQELLSCFKRSWIDCGGTIRIYFKMDKNEWIHTAFKD